MTRGPKAAKAAKREQQLALARGQKGQDVLAEGSVEEILERVKEELMEVREDLQREMEQSALLSQELELGKAKVAELHSALDAERGLNAQLSSELEDARTLSSELSSALEDERIYSKELYRKLHVEKCARQRGQQRKAVLEKKIKELNATDLWRHDELQSVTKNSSRTIDELLKLEKENAGLHSELSGALKRAAAEAAEAQMRIAEAAEKLKASQAVNKKLQKQCARAHFVKERAVNRAKESIHKERSLHKLLHKGTYTEDTRNLVHLLVGAGCSRENVNTVIHAVFKAAGISVKGDVSRRTVSRIILEGYYAAQMQLGYEMEKAKSMTFSGDGTIHRATQFASRRANYSVEDDGTMKHTTHFLGIHSSLDGSSKQSLQAWKDILKGITEIYNQSPLKQSSGGMFRVVDIFVKLAGLHSDHCAKEKKDAQLLEKEKSLAVCQSLERRCHYG